MRKKIRSGEYKHALLRKCKGYGGAFTSISELTEFVQNSTDTLSLRRVLREEVGFQKMLRPVDVKERGLLYKMNFICVEEVIENLSKLLDDARQVKLSCFKWKKI